MRQVGILIANEGLALSFHSVNSAGQWLEVVGNGLGQIAQGRAAQSRSGG
jgi:hypothetical protein